MKEVKKDEIDFLVKNNIIRNSGKGFIDDFGNVIGFSRTRRKRYIEDRFVYLVRKHFFNERNL